MRSSPGWSNHQPDKYKTNLVHSPLKPITKLNAAFRYSPLQEISQVAVLNTNHELPTKVQAGAGAGSKKDAECCIKVVLVIPKLFPIWNSSFRGDNVGAVNQIDTVVEDENIPLLSQLFNHSNPSNYELTSWHKNLFFDNPNIFSKSIFWSW